MKEQLQVNGEVKTFCRICEPFCGLIADVKGGRIVEIKPNPDHVLSKGHRCMKSSGMVDVTYDRDRILSPMKRVGGPGEFEPVSWDEALDDICNRLKKIRDEHGHDAFSTFIGNPPMFGYGVIFWYGNFKKTMQTRWNYSINSEDSAAYVYASYLLFGSSAVILKPDIWRSDFVILIGTNPAVSHGSTVTEPLFRDALQSVIARGGRVVVIDPRKTETASRYEHVGIRAGTDAWLLAAMAQVIIHEGLTDQPFIQKYCSNFDDFERVIAQFTPEMAADHCGVDADTIRSLALAFAKAPTALISGRTGTCTQKHGTLNNVLQNCLNLITGNVDRPGGAVFGSGIINFVDMMRSAGMDKVRENPSRTTGLPDVMGLLPSISMVSDILEPGEGQVKSMMMLGGNPMLTSGGNGPRMAEALESLDLLFSLDLYINETNKYADYVLPVTGFYEREDIPLLGLGNMIRPAFFATPAVIKKQGESRQEWEILQSICKRMGYGGAYPNAFFRWLAKLGIELKPRHFAELMVRTSPFGDWFGLRPKGLSVKKVMNKHPDGVSLMKAMPTGVIEKKVFTEDKKVNLFHPELRPEFEAVLNEETTSKKFPLRLHGQRKPVSQNSWMHNVRFLAPGNHSNVALIHPKDAALAGIADDDEIVITSANGHVQVAVKLSQNMTQGNVSLPHGWGHNGNWRHANSLGGANSNVLSSTQPEDSEKLAGMSVLNGIPVNIRKIEIKDGATV